MDSNAKKPLSSGPLSVVQQSSKPSSESTRGRNSDTSSGAKPKGGARRRENNNGTVAGAEHQAPNNRPSGAGGHNNGNSNNNNNYNGRNSSGRRGAPTNNSNNTNGAGRNNGNGNGHGRQRLGGSTSSASGSGLDGLDALDGYAELNSVYVPGSKKQSLNHLLNFNYAPRHQADARSLQRHGNHQQRGRGGGGISSAGGGHHHVGLRYNKEQFLQAQCQFVVRADAQRKHQLGSVQRSAGELSGGADLCAAADHLVDWSCVEQVHVRGAEEPQCPICLHYPAAAKMTRCGHVYCWPCVLHYLALSDKPWRKCPICYEAIHAGDLRSFVGRKCVAFTVGDVVELQLMCRPKLALQVMPVVNGAAPAKWSTPHLSDAGVADGARQAEHSKLLLAGAAEIAGIVERERAELLQRRADDGADCPESMFIEQALQLLQQRADDVQSMARRDAVPPTPRVRQESGADTDDAASLVSVASTASSAATGVEPADFVIGTASATGVGSELMLRDLQITPACPDADHYYFYQASDAQLLYMHSVNTRMLQAEYGELRCAPPSIRGRIVQKESCSVTDVLRHRLKYLQHLPMSSQFEVVEIELGADVVGPVVQDMFRDELSQRKQKRKVRAAEERNRDKKIDEANDRKMMGRLRGGRSANIDVMSTLDFPNYDPNDFSPTNFEIATFDGPPLVVEEPKIAPAGRNRRKKNTGSGGEGVGGSFARMLTAPHEAAGELWPSLGPLASADGGNTSADEFPAILSANGLRHRAPVVGRWSESDDGLASGAAGGEIYGDNEYRDDGADDDEIAARPNFKSAMAQGWMMSASQTVSQKADRNAGNNAAGGKKKKRKQILFSTNVRSYDGI